MTTMKDTVRKNKSIRPRLRVRPRRQLAPRELRESVDRLTSRPALEDYEDHAKED